VNITGAYKISLELTARKQLLGLIDTANRLTGGAVDIPPDLEGQIETTLAQMRQHQALYDAVRLTVSDDTIVLESGDGEMMYKRQGIRNIGPNRATLDLQAEEMGDLTWNIVFDGQSLLIDSFDGISEYAFTKQE
jgi:hypothetical protein